MKIYELVGAYNDLYELALDEEFNIKFNEAIQAIKESLDFSLEEKAYNYAKVAKNLDFKKASLEGQKEYLKKMLEDIESRIKSLENNKKNMLKSLSEAMDLADIPKFKNEQFTIYHANFESVEVLDSQKALDNNMAILDIKPDKKKIKEALKRGEQLDFAIIKQTKSLIIR